MAANNPSARRPTTPVSGIERLRRAREIYAIARRHDLLPLRRLDTSDNPATASLRAQQGEHLRQTLEEAGGAFIKMGQLLSTQDETLPAEWALALRGLQKDVTPSPWPAVKAVLENAFGGPIGSVFADFDDVPVAAASVAQVHRGTLRRGATNGGRGKAVAVKVLRPGIADALWRDIAVAKQLARLAATVSTRARSAGITGLIDQYATDLLRQTDLAGEARNLTALRAARTTPDEPQDVTLPRLYAEVSSRDVVVMEFLTAPTLTALLDAPDLPSDTIEGALRTVLGDFLRQVLVDGVFHADLHPGNILIDDDGHPSLVDFGAVGRIDALTRKQLVAFLLAYVQDEPDRLADAFLALVPLPADADEDAFRRAFRSFLQAETGRGRRPDIDTITRASKIFGPFHIAVPIELTQLGQAFAILDGTLRNALPTFDITTEAPSLARKVIRERVTVKGVTGRLLPELLAALADLREVPRRIDRISRDLEGGKVNVNIRPLADRADRRALTRWLRLSGGIATGTVLGGAALVYFGLPTPSVPGTLPFSTVGTIFACAAGASFIAAFTGRR